MGREPLNTKTSKPKFSPARPSPVSTIIGTSPEIAFAGGVNGGTGKGEIGGLIWSATYRGARLTVVAGHPDHAQLGNAISSAKLTGSTPNFRLCERKRK
jgi:hypothetical protein